MSNLELADKIDEIVTKLLTAKNDVQLRICYEADFKHLANIVEQIDKKTDKLCDGIYGE